MPACGASRPILEDEVVTHSTKCACGGRGTIPMSVFATGFVTCPGAVDHARWRRQVTLVLAILAAVAACTWAGYEIGLTKGRGWRGALIDSGCTVVCRRIGT